MKDNPILKDQNGNPSSKRYNGQLMVRAGVLLLYAVAGTALYKGQFDIAKECGFAILGGGLTLLGVTVFEFFGKKGGAQ